MDLPLPAQVVPPRRPADGPSPVLVLMHGLGADEQDLLPLAEGLPAELAVVSLRAPHALEWGGFMWYGLRNLGEPDPESWAESLRLAAAAVQAVRADRRWDHRRLYVGGFSQGGVMALGLLATLPIGTAAGTVVLSGYLPAAVQLPALPGQPVFWGHGRQDPVVPATWAEAGMAALRDRGARVDSHWYDIAHGVSGAEVADLAAWLTR